MRDLLNTITPPDEVARAEARRRWNDCAKPLGSLGLLETALEDIAALTGSADIRLDRRAVLVLCADNGVVSQGVTQSPSSVTGLVAKQLAARRTSVCRMAQAARCQVVPVDVGILDFQEMPGVLSRRIGNGTGDISQGPAMTRRQAEQALHTGMELVREQQALGVDLLATGEMGIGNTTTSSAVLSVLLGVSVETVTGRGGGITDDSFRKKKQVIADAIALNRPNPSDPVDVLQKVGGFDLAAMCGAFLGGAASHRPMVIDGFISAVAALCAVRLCPAAGDYLVPSHASYEIGYKLAMEAMGLEPIFLLGMRLGEGSGCPLAFQVLSAACAVINDMATFDQAGIDDGYLDEIREGDKFTVEASK